MEKYIKTSILKLQKDRDNNKLVIFVGAGVSANSKCPSWGTLVDKFADGLGISKEERNESIDYFLKIPQYFYIERGRKEYFDLIEETINNIDPIPNDINKMIFKLKPHTVITTNFDDLIEKTVKSEGLFYTTVRQDTELPYTINGNMIIKMHGDGDLKNIVLKEEDYLNYSKNFPLIENYIKGLFATKTVLFVGYSAKDSDFKMIFQWVKDNLKGNFQPAYLLEVGKKVDRIDYNYYKDRGINILYYDEVKSFIDASIKLDKIDISDEKGIRLLKFMKYINQYDKDDDSDILTKIYNKLKIFEDMNYINKDDILTKLNSMIERGHDSLILYLNPNIGLYELLNDYKDLENKEEELKLKEEKAESQKEKEQYRKHKERLSLEKSNILDIEKLNKLIKILYKSGYEGIGIINNKENNIYFNRDLRIKNNYFYDEFESLLNEFNYKELSNQLNLYLRNDDVYGLEEEFLKKAYYLYKVERYIESYDILKKLSSCCLIQHNYKYFFIAQFNIKQLGVLIREELYFNSNKEYLTKILEEIEDINIEEYYYSIPEQYRKNIEFITQLTSFNYFLKLFYKIQKSINKIRNDKEIWDKGGFSFNNELEQTYIKIIDLINYINRNYIMVSHFKEVTDLYSSFIEAILINYSISGKSDFGLCPNKIKKIDKFLIQIIIKHVTSEDLKQYIKENNIKSLNISTNEIEYLITVLENISKSNKNNNPIHSNLNRTIDKIIILLCNTDVDKKYSEEIIKLFDDYIKLNFLDGSNFNKFLDYIIIQFNNNKDIDKRLILNIIETYILNFSRNELNRVAYQMIDKDRFFRSLVCIIKNLDSNIKLECDNDIEYIINTIKKQSYSSEILRDNLKLFYNFLFIIYDICSENIKNKIESITRDILLKIEKTVFNSFEIEEDETGILINGSAKERLLGIKKDVRKHECIGFIYNALMRDIIIYNKDEQIKFIENILGFFDDDKNDSNQDEIMRYILDLILNKKIKYENLRNLLEPVESKFPMFKFFVDKDNFNYKFFKLDWLQYLKTEEIKEIMNSNSNISELIKLVKNEVKDKKFENIDKEYTDKLLLIIELSNKQDSKNKVNRRYRYSRNVNFKNKHRKIYNNSIYCLKSKKRKC